MSRIVTEVLDLACSRQKGRVTAEVTSVTFTEGCFRTSGLLYEIVPDVLCLARSRQEGRVTENVPTETFSENWFRQSGLLYNIVAEVLELAKAHQEGRAPDILATATFSEGWFRTSGLYEIAERLGWSESKVKQYSALLNNVVTDVLALARAHQNGRVTDEVTSVTFSEYWFRTSGLYNLNRVVTQTCLHLNIKLTQHYCSTPSVSVSCLKKGVFVS